MKKTMMLLSLSLLTILGLTKVSVLFMVESKNLSQPRNYVALDNGVQEVDKVSNKNWKDSWLMNELIPSAEAAKQINLDEERGFSKQNIQSSLALQEKQRSMLEREKMLDERESEIVVAETRAGKKIKALEALQTRIQNLLAQESSIKDKKIKRLTSVYESMKAEKAAAVIAQMDLAIVVKIFLRMNEKQVGKILSFLPPQKAVVISQALTKRIASI